MSLNQIQNKLKSVERWKVILLIYFSLDLIDPGLFVHAWKCLSKWLFMPLLVLQKIFFILIFHNVDYVKMTLGLESLRPLIQQI